MINYMFVMTDDKRHVCDDRPEHCCLEHTDPLNAYIYTVVIQPDSSLMFLMSKW